MPRGRKALAGMEPTAFMPAQALHVDKLLRVFVALRGGALPFIPFLAKRIKKHGASGGFWGLLGLGLQVSSTTIRDNIGYFYP